MKNKQLVIIKLLSLILAFGLTMTNAQELKTELIPQTGHTGSVNAVVFSSDGKVFASASEDFTIKIWDTISGQELRTLSGHTSGVNSVEFSPDGKLLASGSSDHTIKIWNLASGQKLQSLANHKLAVNSVAFDLDGKILASGSADKTIKLWEVASGRELKTLIGNDEVFDISFSIDGNILASGGWKTIKLWNVATEKIVGTLEGHKLGVSAITFSPNGKFLASGSADNTIKIWDLESRKSSQTLTDRASYRDGIPSIKFSPDSKLLASGSYESGGTINVWDVDSGRKIKTFDGKTSSGLSVAFNPDGKTLISAGYDKAITVWDVMSGTELISFFGRANKITSVSFSADGNRLASASSYNPVKLWDAVSGTNLHSLSGQKFEADSVVFSPDGKLLASAGFHSIKLWDAANGRELLSFAEHTTDADPIAHSVYSVAFSPDGNVLASGSDKTVKIWDVTSGKLLRSFAGHQKWVSSVVFSPDGRFLASNSKEDSVTKVWDMTTGKELLSFTSVTEKTLVFSPDSKFLASSYNGIRLTELKTQKQVNFEPAERSITDTVNIAAFSPDGKLLAGAGSDATIKLWDLPGKQELPSLAGHTGEVSSIAFSPNGALLLSGSNDGVLKLWSSVTGKELATLVALNKNDWAVFTPEGLFDGTSVAWKQLIWRFGNNTFSYAPVEAFFNEFYYPGLLQEIMQGKTPKPPDRKLSEIDIRQPVAKITHVDNQKLAEQSFGGSAVLSATQAKREVEVVVEVTENNGAKRIAKHPAASGGRDLRLFRNGSLVKHWQENIFDKESGCEQIGTKPDEPRRAICKITVAIAAGANEFSTYAFNHENVKSNDFTAIVKGADSLKRRGKVNILAVGINEYQNKSHNLKFAVPDAVDFGAELRKQQININNYDAAEVVQLTDTEATKQNILYALGRFAKGEAAKPPEYLSAGLKTKFAAIEKTQPEDVLVIYFAGHGTARCGYDEKTKQTNCDRFYLIPHDGFPANSTDEKARLGSLHAQSISDLELEGVLRDLDAGELMLIVDACNSGQALESEEKRRGPMNSKGLAQLAFEKGMYILTAAQSYQAALEVSRTSDGRRIEHGLLTFSLLEGLTTPKADADTNKEVTEREWLSYAVEAVPRMQLEEMKMRSAENKQDNSKIKKRSDIVFLDGDDPKADPENRALQTPRVFYRRETIVKPLIITKP